MVTVNTARRRLGRNMVLKSDNKDYDDIYIKYEEKENLKIEGRVVQVISNKYL